jgi:NADPH:quinone reductase-like Zn-dependent oxidoreductase
LRQLGADVCVNYRAEDASEIALAETNGVGVDAAFDIEGENLLSRCLHAIRPFDRAAVILPPQGDLSLLFQKNIALYGVFLTRERRRLEEMRQLFERRQAHPLIDTVLLFTEARAAHERMDKRHGRGKIVLRVAPDP